MTYKEHINCRVCGSDKLIPYLDLGYLPLSNNLAKATVDPIHNERYPLKVLLCEDCGLSQLSIVIPQEVMFSHYIYRSSISQGYIDHCRQMAMDLKNEYGLTKDSFHIDIAGNDGALLKEFKDEIGYDKCLNIDPAKNLVIHNENNGIRIFSTFWGKKAAEHLINTGWPKSDLITATNVFAHVDNVKEFIEAAKIILKPSGILVMEFPYLINLIEGGEFDTIYFEHLSYFSIYPLTLLCQQVGLEVLSVSRQNIHGGSVRVTIGRGVQDDTVAEFVKNERENYSNIKPYHRFAEDVQLTIRTFRNELNKLKVKGNKIAGFAASAKGNTLLNCAGITCGTMSYIVDATPEKIGKYSPGTHIPIVSMIDMMRTPPDYLVLLAWNWKDELIKSARSAGYQGKFIIPVPGFEIIN